MNRLMKQLAAKLPKRWQSRLKRLYFDWQLRAGQFKTSEPEYDLLPRLVKPGDWVLDIGANIGHYTARLSELAGPNGRVLAVEPVPETFELLVSNASRFAFQNVSLLNIAASDRFSLASMDIPKLDTGLSNYYRAHLSADADNAVRVLCVPIASLLSEHPIALVKIDAEEHDLAVLRGMEPILKRDHPVLIVEDDSNETVGFLAGIGYTLYKLPGSHNGIFAYRGSAAVANAIRAHTGA